VTIFFFASYIRFYFFEFQSVNLFTINSRSMKNVIAILSVFLFAIILLASGCKKKESPNPVPAGPVPVLATSAVINISGTTATCGGNITSDAGFTVSARGVCWSKGTTPTLADNKTTNGTGAGIFSSDISNLDLGTTYYVRAYATNTNGTGYGSAMSFTTLSTLAVGMDYQGGKVAYLFVAGDPGYIVGEQHGIIAASSDQSSGAAWGCLGTSISNANGTAIGTGFQNTVFIITSCPDAGIAAELCYDLILNGYTDWYLPSKDELNMLYLNRAAIGGFVSIEYWSSSEYNPYNATEKDFISNTQFNISKINFCGVRAVRTF
jgi:hypothetical protein